MKNKHILMVLALFVAVANGAAVAAEIPSQPTQLAMSMMPNRPDDGSSSRRLLPVMSNGERCVMNCKTSYAICREGRGRRNNSICIRELNECLPGC